MRPLFAPLLLTAGLLGLAVSASGPQAAPGGAVWSGTRTTPVVLTKPGIYSFPPGAGIRLSPQDASKGRNALTIKASGVTVENLLIQGGYRGVSVQTRQNITLRNVTVKGSGIPPVGSKHGGSNIILIDCKSVLLDRVTSQDAAGEHCLYAAQSASAYRFTNSTFSNSRTRSGSYGGVFQVNSESGSQAVDFQLTGCRFAAGSGEDVVALMGAGTPSAPVLFQSCTIQGGRRFLASNFAAKRPSYALVKGGSFSSRIVQEGGSWVKRQ